MSLLDKAKKVNKYNKHYFSCLQYACKKQINRNRTDNSAKTNKNNLDFMPFVQNNINGHIEWE